MLGYDIRSFIPCIAFVTCFIVPSKWAELLDQLSQASSDCSQLTMLCRVEHGLFNTSRILGVVPDFRRLDVGRELEDDM